MPKIDFNNVDDIQDFSPLPEDKYLCRVAEVEEATTQYGDEMWKLRFVVEQFQLTRPTRHEQVDHGLGLGREMRFPRPERIGGRVACGHRSRPAVQQRRQAQTANAQAALSEECAAGGLLEERGIESRQVGLDHGRLLAENG